MPLLVSSAYDFPVPPMLSVTQVFPDERIAEKDISDILMRQILSSEIAATIIPGQRIAVLVGSRGITQQDRVVKSTIEGLKSLGAVPFIVPAMGSHGGGLATAQEAILKIYGICEETMGAPVVSSMETVTIGETRDGVLIHVDRCAYEADGIVPINRIKAHTDYDGDIESGLCKMLSIGLGKHNGCARLHQEGFNTFHQLIPEVAERVIHELKVPFGLAMIENAHENLHTLEVVLGEKILQREPELLRLSKNLMPRLNFSEIDVLIVERMGKNITGAGMDPNIIGRRSVGPIEGFNGPKIKRIVALALTEESQNNAIGVSLADFITENLRSQIDPMITYANSIASGNPEGAKIPITLETEEEALRAAIMTCPKIVPENVKIVRIQDTLHLVNIQVSENLFDYCSKDSRFLLE